MKKTSRSISLLLSGLMVTTCCGSALLPASAAETDTEATGAIMTLEERIAAGHEVVLFQFPESAWGPVSNVSWSSKKHTVNVFCNFYAIYGNKKDVQSREWEAPSTSMMADAKGSDTFYFDITDSKQIAEKDDTDDHKMEPGAAYGIVFSTKVNANDPNTLKPNSDGYQTCDLYFNTNCIGDTFVVDEPAKTRENTANSQKIDYCAHSHNGIGKPIRIITDSFEYLDGINPDPAPDAFEVANLLHKYMDIPSIPLSKSLPSLMDKFETNAVDVYWTYVELFGEESVSDCKTIANQLNLPWPPLQRITSVELTLDVFGCAECPANAPYTVITATEGGKTVFTVSPKEGYAFSAKPVVKLYCFPDNMEIMYDNDKTFIDAADGKIRVTEKHWIPVIGDIDGDGEITIQDATLVQRRCIELEAFTTLQDMLADVNGDGRVSIQDVTAISRYLAEMTEGFGNTGKQLYEIA